MTPILVTMLLFQSLADKRVEIRAAMVDRITRDYRATVEVIDAPTTRALLLDLATRAALAGLKAAPTVELIHRGVTPPKLATLPGGTIFVPVDLVRTAKDASDLTRPIAHAVAHIAVDERRFMAQTNPPFNGGLLYLGSGLCEAQSSLRGTAPLHRPEIEAEADTLTDRIVATLAAPSQNGLREAQEELLTIAPPKQKPTLYRVGETAATSSPAPQR